MGQVPRQPFGASPHDDRGAVAGWLPARVPGDVRADLIAAGRIPPVETPEGIAAGQWVDEGDWWYRVALPADITADETVILEADGMDYQSAIWLDDELLATHTGAFARQAIPLPVQPGGAHELAIRIWGGGALPRLSTATGTRLIRGVLDRMATNVEYFPDRMATTKAQFGFGWDFSPRVLSAGIWDDIRLVRTHNAYIENLHIRPDPLTEDDPTAVRWRLRLRVTRLHPCAVRAEVTIRPENFEAGGYHSAGRTINLCPNDAPLCTADYDLAVEMAAARRWQPWDQGEPCLYRVTVRLLDGNAVLDEISEVTGVRTVERGTLPGGAPWSFRINGRPVFLRGANWVPADVLPGRVTADDYDRLIGQARAAGVNFLRVWGGGVREKRAFWDACNRLGILAWQEFPLACAFLDHYPHNAAYLDLLEAEARGAAQLLRNHPALLAWCGGNEISAKREALPLGRLANVLREEDPDRPWIPASPSGGDVHQWGVWHAFEDWATLADARAPFLSEFGLQALPDANSVAEMFPKPLPDSLSDPRWAARLAQTAKLAFYAGDAPDLAALIAQTQRVQAAALQTGIEACRIRREPRAPGDGATWGGDHCGGVAFWQFNEPWPAVSWSVVDRAGRPKAAYAMLGRSYQPLLIAAHFPWMMDYVSEDVLPMEFWIVNDAPVEQPGCRAEAHLDGRLVWSATDINVPPGAAMRMDFIEVALAGAPEKLELALLSAGGAPLACNVYDLSVPRPQGAPPWRAAQMHRLGMRLIGG